MTHSSSCIQIKTKPECVQSTTREPKEKQKGHGGCSQFQEKATTSGTKLKCPAEQCPKLTFSALHVDSCLIPPNQPQVAPDLMMYLLKEEITWIHLWR